MLALAPSHPIQHTPVDCPHRPSPSSTSSSSRPARPPPRRPSSSFASLSSSGSTSSSYTTSAVTSSSNTRPSSQEGPSSPRRVLPHSTHLPHSSHSSNHRHHGDEPPIPPPSRGTSTPNEAAGGKQVESTQFNIHTYDPQQLLRLLASLLTQIATTNDSLSRRDSLASSFQPRASTSPISESHPPIWRTLTTASREALSSSSSLTFHARNIPSITLEAYLIRILKYCPASNEVFLSLLVYFDRMSKLAKEANGRLFVIDSYNIHRLVIAGVTVASKFFSDVFYTNSRYAKVGGLPQAELNQLELQFLLLNDFRLMITMEEMQSYAEQLIRFSQSNSDPDLPPFTPYSSSSPNDPSPAGPTKFMSYVDAHHHGVPSEISGQHHNTQSSRTPQVHPARPSHRSASSYSSTTTSDAASEAETDVEGSTDDDLTIRPSHSSASSETMSVKSVASDADSMYADDGDRGEESYDADSGTEARPEQDYRMTSP